MYIQLENSLNEIFELEKLDFLMFLWFLLADKILPFSFQNQVDDLKMGLQQKSWMVLESLHFRLSAGTKKITKNWKNMTIKLKRIKIFLSDLVKFFFLSPFHYIKMVLQQKYLKVLESIPFRPSAGTKIMHRN